MSLNYSLVGKTYKPTEAENLVITNNPPEHADDWQNPIYKVFKDNLKKFTIWAQFDRCAYCRKVLEADAYYEPLEHIVAKSLRPNWLLIPQNLIVTCDRCNNLKSNAQTLNQAYLAVNDFPYESIAFTVFNPHFDNWGDHFVFENDIFLVPIANSKGAETIRICKLFKYHIIVNRAKELKLGHKEPLGRMIHRLVDLDRNSESYEEILGEIKNAMQHFNDRVQDMF